MPTDVFAELVGFPEFLAHPQLEVDVLLIIEEEHLRHSPGGPWRRQGWAAHDAALNR